MTPPDSRPTQWIKSNLAALGSAAVLSVYAAGYLRTQEAAARFADEANERRPPRPLPPPQTLGAVDAQKTLPRVDSSAVAPAVAPGSTPARTQPKRAPVQPKLAAATPVPVTRLDSLVAAASASVPAQPAPKQPAAPQPVASIVPSPTSPPAAPITTPAPAPVTAVPAPAPPAATVADSAANEKKPVVLKDGVYSGWGSSRHGDIQAYVEIKAGRIVSAFISECLTQYSCSWIAKLPPQVAARQSAEVDYVSGATQSSNAFYYAVVDALKKAK